MNHTKAGRALSALITETFRLNGAILLTGDRLVEDLGLTSARWQVLAPLTHGSATVSEISRKMGLSRQNVQRIANRLLKDGFIEMVENPAHMRAKLCVLSESGKRAMEEVSRRQTRWANDVSNPMQNDELSQAVALMERVRKQIEAVEYKRKKNP